MAQTTDSSVVMALTELAQMEADRIALDRQREAERAETARAERERAAAAEREALRAKEEREAAERRVAEAKARLELEADRQLDQRIAAMRAELSRVEAERQTLKSDLEARLERPAAPARPGGWAMAFGLSSLVAASLAGLLVMQQARQPLPVAAPVVAAPIAVAPPAVEASTPPIAPAPVVAETTPVETAQAPAHPTRPSRRTHDGVRTETHRDSQEIVGLGDDDGSEDVLGPELAGEAHRVLHR